MNLHSECKSSEYILSGSRRDKCMRKGVMFLDKIKLTNKKNHYKIKYKINLQSVCSSCENVLSTSRVISIWENM